MDKRIIFVFWTWTQRIRDLYVEYGQMVVIGGQAARIKDYGLTVKIKTYYDLSVTGSVFKLFLQSYPQIYPQPK